MVTLGTTIHGTMTTSSKKDYLSILGLSYEFDDIELKKAFRREARKWHPDLNKNDINAEDRFKLINEAYEFLRDPARRAKTIDSNSSNDENINNDDNEHSGSPILKRLMRPSPKYFLSIFSHIFPSLWFGFHWFSQVIK